jgi:hypothetical protein
MAKKADKNKETKKKEKQEEEKGEKEEEKKEKTAVLYYTSRNRNSSRVHRHDCRYVKVIIEKDPFRTLQDAIDSGRKNGGKNKEACRVCKP